MTKANAAIALNLLTPWSGNLRQNSDPKQLEELKASIKSLGLLQSIVVRPDGDRYVVISGNRRLAALNSLVEEKAIANDIMVPCRVLENGENDTEINLAENVVRENMHPADQFDAFQRMTEEGKPIADIAADFGVADTYVKKMLRLSNVAPEILADYRAGKITLEAVQAYAVTDDHKAQLKARKSLPQWKREEDPDDIREILTEKDVTGDDRRVQFIGFEAYKNAGGKYDRDLFVTDDSGIFIRDVKLLDKLAEEKLAVEAEKIKAEGWSWMISMLSPDTNKIHSYDRKYPKTVELSKADAKQLQALQKERMDLADIEDEDKTPEQQSRDREVEQLIGELCDKQKEWSDTIKRSAGVIVTIDSDGDLRVERGLVDPKAKKADKKQPAAKGKSAATPAAAKAEDAAPATMPRSTNESLIPHKTAAVAATLLKNSSVALALLAAHLASDVFFDGDGEESLLTLQGGTVAFDLEDAKEYKGAAELIKDRKAWTAKLPADPNDLLPWALKQKPDVIQALLTFCIASLVDVASDYTGKEIEDMVKPAADIVGQATGMKISDWFTATADNLFDSMPAALIQATLKEELPEENAIKAAGMKKAALVAYAAKAIPGYVPPVLRSRLDKAPAAAATPKPEKKKAAAAKKPVKTKKK